MGLLISVSYHGRHSICWASLPTRGAWKIAKNCKRRYPEHFCLIRGELDFFMLTWVSWGCWNHSRWGLYPLCLPSLFFILSIRHLFAAINYFIFTISPFLYLLIFSVNSLITYYLFLSLMTYYFFIHFFVFALTHPFTFDTSWTKLDRQLISTHACVNRHYLYSQTPDNQGL